jgi:hypothetical protein
MLSLRYGHVKQGKTGVLDYFFERYLVETKGASKSLIEWAESGYEPLKLREDFKSRSRWWANMLVDRILRRE